jgi:glutamyl-tRNA synthetase
MILGADKTRLSKRHGATSVMAYKEMGFLPEAMVNYLVRLGWSYGDQEIFTMDELIEKFGLENVGRSAGVFNPDKLLWLNAHYIKSGDPVRLGNLLREYLDAMGVSTEGGPELPAVVRTLQERSRTMVEMAEGAAFYFSKEVVYDPEAAAKHLTADKQPVLAALQRGLKSCTGFDEAAIEAVFAEVLADLGLKLGKVGPAVRVALVGGTVSPGIYEVLAVLGREESLRRLANAIQFLQQT